MSLPARCAVVLLTAAAGLLNAAVVEAAGVPEDTPEAASAAKETAQAQAAPQIGVLLRDLSLAIMDGDDARARRLLAPAYRDEIHEALKGELSRHHYERLRIEAPRPEHLIWLDLEHVKITPLVSYRYTTTDGRTVEDEQAYEFVLRHVGDGWLVEQSALLDQFTGTTISTLWWRALVFVVVGLTALVFWGWMLFDCSLRYHRTDLLVLILVTFVPGALVYFFLGFLRGGGLRLPTQPAAPAAQG